MFKHLMIIGLLSVPAPAFCATVDGHLVSIDTENHRLTLDSGAVLNLTESVVLDGLSPGQLVRATYTDGTIDVTAIDVLEDSPPPESTDNTTSVDNTSTPVGDTSTGVDDTSSDTTQNPAIDGSTSPDTSGTAQ